MPPTPPASAIRGQGRDQVGVRGRTHAEGTERGKGSGGPHQRPARRAQRPPAGPIPPPVTPAAPAAAFRPPRRSPGLVPTSKRIQRHVIFAGRRGRGSRGLASVGPLATRCSRLRWQRTTSWSSPRQNFSTWRCFTSGGSLHLFHFRTFLACLLTTPLGRAADHLRINVHKS